MASAVGSLRQARGALWTLAVLGLTRHRLRRDGLAARVPPPRWVTDDDRRGARRLLDRVRGTCLERALVLQRWMAVQGVAADVVIGVRHDGDGIAAHAWVDRGAPDERYRELHRIAP